MAISDIYTADSGLVNISVTTANQPVLNARTAATKRCFITGVRMKVGVNSIAAGNTVLFTLARVTTAGTGGTQVTARPHDSTSAAAFTTAFIPSYTIAPTIQNILAEWVLPCTTGSMWEEFPPLGYEWVAPISDQITGFVTLSNAASAVPVEWQFVISE
jgi:hypothetical protein